jgi:hypothetical protein
MATKQIHDSKSQVGVGSNYAATTAINSVMLSKKASVPPMYSHDVSKLTNNHNFEFVNTSLMSTGGKQRQGRN